jgi:hypothetical protein
MKTHIDIKSALCGLGLGILAMLAVGAGSSSSQTGRFQIATEGSVALLIDTETGQVWTKCWRTADDYKSDEDFSEPKLETPRPRLTD